LSGASLRLARAVFRLAGTSGLHGRAIVRMNSGLAWAVFRLARVGGLHGWLAGTVDLPRANRLDSWLTWTVFGLAWAGGLHSWLAGTVDLSWASRLDSWFAGTIFRLARPAGLHSWLARTVELAGTVGLNRRLTWAGGLDGGARDGGDGPRGGDQSGTALVHVVELLTILRGLALVLILRGHGWDARAAVGCDLGGLRANVDAAATAVVGDAVDSGVVDYDCTVIDVGDACDVDVVDRAVVVEVAALPVTAVIAAAGVAEAVVHTAVETNVLAPKAAVKEIATAEEAPVAGRPEGTVEGRRAPGSGDPIVADGGVSPIAGGPEIVGRGGFGLLVFRERRWRLVCFFESLLAGVYLGVVVVGGCVVVIVLVVVLVRGLSGLGGGDGLVLRRWAGLLRVLLGALLGRGLGADAEDSGWGRLRGRRGLAATYWCHVGIGWVGSGVVGDGCRPDIFVTA
jgi:hypothetical protein